MKVNNELYISPAVSGPAVNIVNDINKGNCWFARDCATAFGVVGVIVIGGAAVALGAVTGGSGGAAVLVAA